MLDPAHYAPYSDPEQYILEWTDRIWEHNALGAIREHYSPTVRLHGAYGGMSDVESVIRGSLMKKFAFPNRSFTGEDVIWEERGEGGFVSSHRTLNVGTQEGFWQYGPPSHRQSVTRNVALCLVRDALLIEEWVTRDEWGVVEQSGLDPWAIADELASTPNPQVLGAGGIGLGPAPSDPIVKGDSGERPDHHRAECTRVLEFLELVWNQRRFDKLPDYLHRDVVAYTSRNRVQTRSKGYFIDLGSLLAAVPDATFEIRDVAANRSELRGMRVSVMWRMQGTYSGVPAYGPVTHSPVELIGFSHFLLFGTAIYREWRVYDELSLLVQIERARGGKPTADGSASPAPAPAVAPSA